MSRTLDLLLIALVLGLAWWLFGRREATDASVGVAAPVRAAAPAGPPGPTLPEPTAPAGPGTLAWSVDDPTLLAHPALVFVLAEAGTARLAALDVDFAPDGVRASATLGARPSALGIALALPTLEVLAWVPLAPASDGATLGAGDEQPWSLVESPLRLADRLHRVSLEAVDRDGLGVEDAKLHWPNAGRGGPLSADSVELLLDLHGKALLPRRAGNTVLVTSARGHARVSDPMDGMRVVLESPR